MVGFTEQKDWSILGFGDELVLLIHNVNLAASQGIPRQWFNAFTVLYMNVKGHQNLNKDEIKKIDESMDECRSLIKELEKSNMASSTHKMKEDDLKWELYTMTSKLMEEMYKVNLLLSVVRKQEHGKEVMVSR